jgi:Response regulator containing CheY-like receiver, AAA-type ATPase, and DNA-binding domains
MLNILLVDDEWTQRYLLIKILREYGQVFTVKRECENGEEALEALSETDYDVVFTDIRMPVLDGIRLLQEIREKNIDIPVVLVSTHSDFEYARQGLKYGAFDYLVKPIEKDKLFNVLDQVKTHIENKTKSRDVQEKVEQALKEKLDFGLQEDYVDTIFTILHNTSDEVNTYIQQIIKYHLAMYANDYFKLGVMFENIIKNVEERLLNNHGHARKLYEPSQYSKDNVMTNINEASITETIRKEFLKIFDFIHKLHLDITDEIIQKMCYEVISKPDKKLTLEEIAQQLNYNNDYLSRLFKSKTGESFSQFSIKVKMEHAKKLLQCKIYKSYEISEMLGYKDVEYFSKLFRDSTGMFPSEYKKNYFGKVK